VGILFGSSRRRSEGRRDENAICLEKRFWVSSAPLFVFLRVDPLKEFGLIDQNPATDPNEAKVEAVRLGMEGQMAESADGRPGVE